MATPITLLRIPSTTFTLPKNIKENIYKHSGPGNSGKKKILFSDILNLGKVQPNKIAVDKRPCKQHFWNTGYCNYQSIITNQLIKERKCLQFSLNGKYYDKWNL